MTSLKSSGQTVRLSEDVSNDSRHFYTFVTSRVQSIWEYSEPNQRRKVDTKKSPAGEASIGLTAEELVNSPRRWSGPDFLWKPYNNQPSDKVGTISENDLEVKKTTSFAIRIKSFCKFSGPSAELLRLPASQESCCTLPSVTKKI